MIVLTKAKATLSLDPYTYEKAKRTYDSVSQRVEDLLNSDLDTTKLDDVELLEKKLGKIDEKINGKNDEIEELELEKRQLEDEKTAIENKIKEKQIEKENREEELEKFNRIFEKNYKGQKGWSKPQDISPHWPEELEKSKEELWNLGKEALK